MNNLRQLALSVEKGVLGGVTRPYLSRVSSQCSIISHKKLSQMSCSKCLTLENMNPAIKVMEYAVRGPLVIRAAEIEKELKESVLKLLISQTDGKKAGVMVPIPQYPLYSATISEFDMHLIGYYLDEASNWSLSLAELERALSAAKEHCEPRAIVVINPGNPTGQVLTRKNIEEIIKFAHKEKLFILADEVYQHNVYDPNSKFFSFKKVLTELGPPYCEMELASFMSCSKGFMGECGLRGGYSEVINLDPDVQAMFTKSISAMLCPNTIGQATLDCVVTPLKESDPSYELFEREKSNVLNSLKERAKMVEEAFNACEGMSCNIVQGAMYAFPQIKIPPKAVEKAKALNQCPSVLYCFELLEQTGVCVVPGAGFGQVEGTYHFR
ncbi:unnamed protein product [Nezara viridula]|uniref:alanine transaminase n=1 Tax=Nezara viridula TaxID=85310 RepID=A0A9P0HAM7_NEZVI|nr:unnamed protein product [Nezara viridula]